MTKLWDIFSEDLLNECFEKGLVRVVKHSTKPYTLLNYTEQCQYEKGNWNDCTLACRGLIYNHETGEVVARPFKKFFNYGDSMAKIDMGPICVTDKMDGSLGILYDDNCIATRGSFESDQAIHATELFRHKYSHYKPPLGRTMLFEIIYPTNRIVLDYGDLDDLVLLGTVEIETGMSMSPRYSSWDGPKTMMFAYNTLQEVLDAPARSNAEGLVIHFFDTDERIKIKQDDYVALHKIISGLNERVVWEHISNGNELETLLDGLPDEFHVWVREVAGRLKATVEASAREVESAYSAILATLPEGYTQKDFAMIAKEHPRKSELFARHVGKSYWDKLWKDIYPDAKKSPRNSDSALDN